MAQDAAVNDAALPTTVLVVEDDVLLRMFAVEMIEDAGFRAVSYTHLTLPTNREV